MQGKSNHGCSTLVSIQTPTLQVHPYLNLPYTPSIPSLQLPGRGEGQRGRCKMTLATTCNPHAPFASYSRRPCPLLLLLPAAAAAAADRVCRLCVPRRRLLDRSRRGGVQVCRKGEDVEGEDDGERPLDDGGLVVPAAAEEQNHERGGEGDLDDDKGDLCVERDAQRGLLVAVAWLLRGLSGLVRLGGGKTDRESQSNLRLPSPQYWKQRQIAEAR